MQTAERNIAKTEGVIISHLVADYLDSLRLRRLSPKTIEVYSRALDRFVQFLKKQARERVQDVTAADLEAYRLALVEGNLAPASIEIYLRSMRQFFSWLESSQILFLNPAAGLVIPAPERKLLPVPSEEEIRRLLVQPNVHTNCGLRDRALLETAYSTGARGKELCGLQLKDLDLEQGLVRVLGKGKKQRMLPLGQEAVRWLKQYIAEARAKLLKGRTDESALWLTTRGTPLGYMPWAQLLRRHVQGASLTTPVSPHSIRRACATHMLRHGAHPLQLQLLLGHSSLKTLSQYLRLTIAEIKATHAQSPPGR
jgi:integrase/recombinase XerD